MGFNTRGGFGSAQMGKGGFAPSIGASTPLLLDLYPNAAAAYSVRKLRSDYSGSALRVRRSSDNAEQDIGFVGVDLDTTSLLTFVGAGDGFVVTWYDQSGNGNNATNPSASSQPQIVSSGVLTVENNRVCLMYQGVVEMYLISSGYTLTQPDSFFIVNRNNPSASDPGAVTDAQTGRRLIDSPTMNYRLFAGVILSGGVANNNQNLYSAIFNSTTSSLHVNGNSILSGDAGALNASNIIIGNNTALTDTTVGSVQEMVIYDSDQSANRAAIEADINAYYSIY